MEVFQTGISQGEMLAAQTKQSEESSDVLFSMQTTYAYKGIFPQMFTLLDILMAMPIGTATVERSFSQMKLTKLDYEIACLTLTCVVS